MDREPTQLDEILSVAGRRKLGRSAKRRMPKILRAKKRNEKKLASRDKIKGRAKKQAIKGLKNKFSKGKYNELSPAQKARIDARVNKLKGKVERTAKKNLPSEIKKEKERLKKFRERGKDTKKESFIIDMMDSLMEGKDFKKIKDADLLKMFDSADKKMKKTLEKELKKRGLNESISESSDVLKADKKLQRLLKKDITLWTKNKSYGVSLNKQTDKLEYEVTLKDVDVKDAERLGKELAKKLKIKYVSKLSGPYKDNLFDIVMTETYISESRDEEYEKFFKAALKKFGVDEPDQLKGEKKKEFFDYVDANWEGENEVAEAKLTQKKLNVLYSKALGVKKLSSKHKGYTSAVADNGDFIVYDGGKRIVGRLKKGSYDETLFEAKKKDTKKPKKKVKDELVFDGEIEDDKEPKEGRDSKEHKYSPEALRKMSWNSVI